MSGAATGNTRQVPRVVAVARLPTGAQDILIG